jgi:VWFA-related protein
MRARTFGPIAVASCLAVAAVLAQQAPTFKSGVELVLIDVTVVSKDGRPVGDLTPGDFALRVDGRSRRIASAQFLRYDMRTTTVAGGSPAPATPAGVASSSPPPRLVLIVIDEDSIGPVEGLAARQAAGKFLDKLGPTDRIAVVTIPRLRSEVTFSTRRSDAKTALDAVITGVNQDRYEFDIGLAEAFDIQKGYADVAQRVVARECHSGQPTPGATVRPMDNDCPPRVMMQARQMVTQAQLRGQRSLDALAGLADGLASVDGPKTLLLISGGMPMPDLHSLAALDRIESAFAAAQVTLYTLYMERSSFGQVRNRPSPTAFEDDLLERDGIENATSVTGGTLMLGIGTLDQYFERVVTELSGSYLLGVEVESADRDGRAHQVDVKVNRGDVEIRARKRYVIETPRGVEAAPAVKRTPGKDAGKAIPPPITVELMTPEAEAAVARASSYATSYETQLSGLVAEERYLQRSFKYETRTVTYTTPIARGQTTSTTQVEGEWVVDGDRKLKADFLLVKAPGGDRWLPFRDVFEVDGKQVREREERLQQLFLRAPATAAERAKEITAESARYNIGFVERNINVPTLALRLLDPARRSLVLFRRQGEATVSGVRTWELGFAERGSPTVVRDGEKDIPATGAFWIDPVQGRVVRSTMRLKIESVAVEITVTYQPDAKANGTWVPAEMREVYLGANRRLECTASYSKIRRFQVTTDEVQKNGPAGDRRR